MISNDMMFSGILRAICIFRGDYRVYIPAIHSPTLKVILNDDGSLNESEYEKRKISLPTVKFNSIELQKLMDMTPTPCWIMFEESDGKRPIVMGYFGKGLKSVPGASVSGGTTTGGNTDGSSQVPPIDVDEIVTDSKLINDVINWAVNIANDNSHGYVYGAKGPTNYDCSGFIWAAYNKNGLSNLQYAYTGAMRSTYMAAGFVDVTSSINFSTGEGLQPGDVLVAVAGGHTDMYIGNGQRVGAHSSRTGIYVDAYGWNQPGYNNKYDLVLRYNKQ